MKKLLTFLLLIVGLSIMSYGQTKTKKTDTIQVEEPNEFSKDPDVYVYKCIDSMTNEIVYVDLIEEGYVGFYTNKTFIKYRVSMYSLTSKDSTWTTDRVSIYFDSKMPIEAIGFNEEETKICIFSFKNSSSNICKSELIVLKKLKGVAEARYLKRRNKSATFIYGSTNIPFYIKYETK